MKLKSLLFMVTLLLVCLGARADEKVVFTGQFDAQPTDPSAVGFYEYINSEPGDERSVADGVLTIINDAGTLDKTARWQRAVKFRNLPLKEGLYRLDFKLKGSTTYKDGEADVNCKFSTLLLQGEDNADISLLDESGNEQRLEAEAFNPDEFVSYSKTFLFASEKQQKEKYAAQDKGELADKFFLSLSVYNPGTFYVKDLVLSELEAVSTAEFGDAAIKISFRTPTNIAAMAKADPKGLVFFDDLSFASVTLDGEPADIEAIEYHDDGCLYIFLTEDYIMESTSVVSVSFTNPTDDKQIKFNSNLESEASIFSFENFEVKYNEELDGVLSYLYAAPALMASHPADNSFAINPQLGEFSFIFDRKVKTDKIVAVLNRAGEESRLILKEGQEALADSVVFVRNDNGVLAKKNSISISKVISDKSIEYKKPFVINFEAGIPKIAQEIINPIDTVYFDRPEDGNQSGMIPRGWTLDYNIVNDEPEEVRPTTPETTYGSGPRIMGYQKGDYKNVFYVRSTNGYTTATYGNLEGYTISIPAGELNIDFMASGYKAHGQKIRCEVLDATGKELAGKEFTTNEDTPDWNWGGCTDPTVQGKYTVYLNNTEEQNVILRYTVIANGQQETILSAVVINTYEKTEGEVPDDQTIFADPTFGDTPDNQTPAASTGWELWLDGDIRPSGQGYSGQGTRIFTGLGLKGLSVGYYNWNNWPNGFMIYGNGKEGTPKLSLPAGILEFTYYAANWKGDNSQNIYFQILDASDNDKVIVDKVTQTSANTHMNGDRKASYEADKFTFTWDCPAAGQYKIKIGGSGGENFIGNISIVKPGSRAVRYFYRLLQAVEAAKTAQAEANKDSKFDGTTKTALDAAIAKYEDQDKITMTTEEEFDAAIEELTALTESMEARIKYIDKFTDAYVKADDLYTKAIQTKYEKLDCFKVLEEAVNTYESVSPSSLDDEELISATTTMEDASTLYENMTHIYNKDVQTDYMRGVEVMTKQIVGLADQLVALDPTRVDDEYVTAVGNAVTDDQDIAEQLKLRLTKAIYEKCAKEDPFNVPVYDPVTGDLIPGETTPDSISVTNYIQNGGFYVMVTTNSRDMQSGDQIPGWTIDKVRGNVGYEFSWVTWNGSKLNPVLDAPQMIAGWNSELDFSQLLSELPVGKYRLVVGTQDRGFEDNSDEKTAALDTRQYWHVTGTTDKGEREGDIFSYIYTQTGEAEPVKTGFDITNQGQWYGKTDCNSVEFDVTEDDKAKATGSVKVGARMIEYRSTASIDNFRLYMIGKAKDYDYAAAAAKVAARIDGSSLKGDANNDGRVSIADVTTIAAYLLGDTPESFSPENADANGDGRISIADVTTVATMLLNEE